MNSRARVRRIRTNPEYAMSAMEIQYEWVTWLVRFETGNGAPPSRSWTAEVRAGISYFERVHQYVSGFAAYASTPDKAIEVAMTSALEYTLRLPSDWYKEVTLCVSDKLDQIA